MVRAIRIDRPGGTLRVMEQVVPDVGHDEVLVRSAAVGICGSDIDLLTGERPEGFATYPVVPGHEWSAVVARVGSDVRGWSVGDPVAVAALTSCGVCNQCRDQRSNVCDAGYSEFGFTRPGGLAEDVAVPAEQLHAVPTGLPLDVAPLLEPAAVVMLAARAVSRFQGRTVCVVGDGALGQLAAQVARVSGAGHVAVFGTHRSRLALAKLLGADETYDVTSSDRAAGDYRQSVSARGADVVLEAGGSVSAVELALGVAARGSQVVLTGVAGGKAALTMSSDLFVVRSLTVSGIVGSTPASWVDAITLAGTGQLQLAPLVTHRFAFHDAASAYDLARAADSGTVKVVITHDTSAPLNSLADGAEVA